MTLPLDRAVRAGKSLTAEIGDERVVQFVIVERKTGTERGQIETGPLRMRNMVRVDRGDRALPQRLPPGGVGHDCTVGDQLFFVDEALEGPRDCFLAKVRF